MPMLISMSMLMVKDSPASIHIGAFYLTGNSRADYDTKNDYYFGRLGPAFEQQLTGLKMNEQELCIFRSCKVSGIYIRYNCINQVA